MAHREEIEFVIYPSGAVEEKVTGIAGTNCTAVTEAIEKALGTTVARDLSGEYYQQSDAANESITQDS